MTQESEDRRNIKTTCQTKDDCSAGDSSPEIKLSFTDSFTALSALVDMVKEFTEKRCGNIDFMNPEGIVQS